MKNMIIYCIISISYLFAHCQVPCGIYDDARRVIEIEEHIQTIDKAMDNILKISSWYVGLIQKKNMHKKFRVH